MKTPKASSLGATLFESQSKPGIQMVDPERMQGNTKAETRNYLWLGLSLTNLHLPESVLRTWLVWASRRRSPKKGTRLRCRLDAPHLPPEDLPGEMGESKGMASGTAGCLCLLRCR